jgi:N-acetylmuramoyl-L-alanine amidase-like protein
MSLRCHFNADGWLTGPISISHHMTPNRFNSGFAARARGVVQHTEDGFEAGTFATFMDPGSQVSAFFSIGEDGTGSHQYLPVGRGLVAWAQADGNPDWYSIECEDKLSPGTPMTDVQLTVFAQIYSALAERDGFGYAVTDDPSGGRGLITHGDGGNAWGGHPDCPGPVRRAQRPEILARAQAVRDGLDIWICQGAKSLHDLAADKLGGPVHQVLGLTAEYSVGGLFSPAMAGYLNAVFAADAQQVPAGVVLFCPKQGGGVTQVTSPGDQTLRALAQAHDTQCSSVVRATAEHSPGGAFAADLAAHLDAVFAASAAHITKGIRLFYRKQ